MFAPQALIGAYHLVLVFLNALEQAAQQHGCRLILLRGIHRRRHAGGDAGGFRDPIRDELVLLAVRIRGAAIGANGQGVNERGVRRSVHRLEERGEERRELVSGALCAPHFAEVNGQFVQQNQRRFAAEQLAQRLGAGCHAFLIAAPHTLVAAGPGQGVGDFAPRRVRQDAVAHRPAVGRVGVLAIERADAHGAGGEQVRIDELAHIGYAFHAAGSMDEGDQAVRLATAVGRVQAENGGRFLAGATQAVADVRQQLPQAAGGVGVGEEVCRVSILGIGGAGDHRSEVGREIRIPHAPSQHVRAGLAELKDVGKG